MSTSIAAVTVLAGAVLVTVVGLPNDAGSNRPAARGSIASANMEWPSILPTCTYSPTDPVVDVGSSVTLVASDTSCNSTQLDLTPVHDPVAAFDLSCSTMGRSGRYPFVKVFGCREGNAYLTVTAGGGQVLQTITVFVPGP